MRFVCDSENLLLLAGSYGRVGVVKGGCLKLPASHGRVGVVKRGCPKLPGSHGRVGCCKGRVYERQWH